MESWFQCFLLITTFAYTATSLAQENSKNEADSVFEAELEFESAFEKESRILDEVINPDIKRRKFDESRIDTENFELGFSGGVMSIEDFGSSNSFAAKTAYHINENWFIEATVGQADTNPTSWEILTGGRIVDPEETELTYYNVSLGFNIFPGEIFLSTKYVFNTSYYLMAGLGNTTLGGDEFFTYNFGSGFKIFPTDWVALRIGFQNHIFTHDVLGLDRSVQNLEAHIGASFYF